MTRLSGKRAIVVGGTSGIGAAVAAAFRREGAQVVITGRRATGAAHAEQIGAQFAELDVTDQPSVARVFFEAAARLGGLDVVVLNAGIAQPVTGIGELDNTHARAVVETNLLGVLWGLQAAAATIADGGSVIVTSSAAAVLGLPTEAVYAATKAAVSTLVRCCALELGARGVRVNAVQPGAVETDMNQMPAALFAVLTPLGRKGQVEDLSGLYCYLASDESRYLTGQGITVDGGLSAGLTTKTLRAANGYARKPATGAQRDASVAAR